MSDIVKITSGTYRGRKIATPGGKTHPMGERERLALFNIIGDEIKDKQVLDAYAGSGALGFEALSRGAKEVLFVEEGHVAMRTIVNNAISLGIPEQEVAFYRGAVGAFYRKFVQGQGAAILPSMAASTETFPKQVDIILADPPYDDFNPEEIRQLAEDYLRDGGLLVLSHPDEAPEFQRFTLEDTRQYAGAHLSFYRK